jgi:hypothetical protein
MMRRRHYERNVHQMALRALAAWELASAPGGPEKWVGHVVKKAFPCDPGLQPVSERMFVWVIAVTHKGQLMGKLVNTPFFCSYLEHGDVVILDESEIEELAE